MSKFWIWDFGNLSAIFPLENGSKNYWWKMRIYWWKRRLRATVTCRRVVFDQKCDMSIRNFKNIESPKMVSKRLYGHYLRRYEQIKTNRILIVLFSKKKTNLLMKKASQSHSIVQKSCSWPKMRYEHQKLQKYWKSKNGVKTALRPLF